MSLSQCKIRSPKDAYDLVQSFVEDVDREHFLVVSIPNIAHPQSTFAMLAVRMQLNPIEGSDEKCCAVECGICLFGSQSSERRSNAKPGEHPSDSEPILVGEIFGIEVMDHLIVGDSEFVLLKEKGHI